MPDIDLDFPRDIREVLIPRVHERYGHEHSALVAAFPTYRPKGAIRDLGKVLGLPPAEIDKVAKTFGFHETSAEIERDLVAALGPGRAAEPRWRVLLELAREIMGLPRNASQHPGGMVISTRPLIDVCPVVPAAMVGRQIVQWDKDSCGDAGFLKIDLLGLGMLSAVERTVEELGAAAASGSTSPASRSTTSRPTNRSAPPTPPASSRSRAAPRCRCCPAPSRGTSTTSPSRWRWCARGRSRAARSTPTSNAASACARTRPSRSPTSTRCCARCWRRRWGRSSTRSR